ncbi:tetratricopeptide repeat protein [Flavobacterium sp. UGB4466]|uniref:tetratricopeptide repeat protein n=1 Tax=Flavobacterium sp. UGB4466 TaxID=2730889 RepID=UPI00192B4C6C|nr:tetratricopeptide repeat protein [Flavobacterium sp. UGB4466]
MNKFKLSLVVLFLISFKCFACLNGETKTLKNGYLIYIDYKGIVPHGHNFDAGVSSQLLFELDSIYKKTKDIDYLSDKGYVLIVLKKYEEALKLYLSIEKIKPNRYSTASNLGTLYELMGENEKAYDWIKKSIQINSESHEGSEWIHLKILETKIKNLNNVSGEFLIGTSFGTDEIPKSNLSKSELERLSKSIYYQLNERITFLKPKDRIISILLFELANIVKIIEKNKTAIEIYEQAKEYGLDDELINKRLQYCYKFEIDYCEDRNLRLYDANHDLRDKMNGIDRDYVNQIEILLIILSIVLAILIIALAIFYTKWKSLRDYIFLNDLKTDA